MATILPLGETTFFDANGDPLVGGTVAFYIPGTTTPKDTYQDSQQSILNTNPVVLDSAGRAIIFGSGSYRQVVKDSIGNIVWDQITGEPNAGIVSSGGTSSGTPNAQTLTAGTFDGTDGATIQFVAGLSNTGPMTLSVGGGSPISVLKNGPTGPIQLATGDVVSGNIYSVAYSTVQASFQLISSIPPTFSIASEPDAEEGTNNTDLMTPLRVRQATNQAREDLASSTTCDLGSVSTQSIRITGTATIISFGASADAGTRKRLYFASSLTLRHNATSLILPNGGSDIVTGAGDSCEVLCLGSGNWVVSSYQDAEFATLQTLMTRLVYTGSSSSNSDFPIGTIVAVRESTANRNGSATIYRLINTGSFYTANVSNGEPGSALTGTWRHRGRSADDGGYAIYQRTA